MPTLELNKFLRWMSKLLPWTFDQTWLSEAPTSREMRARWSKKKNWSSSTTACPHRIPMFIQSSPVGRLHCPQCCQKPLWPFCLVPACQLCKHRSPRQCSLSMADVPYHQLPDTLWWHGLGRTRSTVERGVLPRSVRWAVQPCQQCSARARHAAGTRSSCMMLVGRRSVAMRVGQIVQHSRYSNVRENNSPVFVSLDPRLSRSTDAARSTNVLPSLQQTTAQQQEHHQHNDTQKCPNTPQPWDEGFWQAVELDDDAGPNGKTATDHKNCVR